MTAPDLCRLATKVFPSLTFVPIDTGRTISARSPELRIRQSIGEEEFAVVVRGRLADYTGTGPTIEAAHADALALRDELEPAPTASVPAQLPLF